MNPPPKLTPIFTDARDIREKIRAKAVAAVQGALPLDLRGRTLELADVRVEARDYSPVEQKAALMREGGTLQEAVKGTLVLKDAGGRVLDTAPNFTLVHLPFFTERHTVILGGNEYQIANQIRRKPGVYTERSENGELSTFYNLSRGRNFSLVMNPEKGSLYLNYGTTNIPLYAALAAIGVPHDDIARHLGPGVASVNRDLYGAKLQQAVDKLYDKLASPHAPRAHTYEAKVEAIKKHFANTAMDGAVNELTLGTPHARVTPNALLDGARRLLDTYQGKKPVDDADSLAYKSFHAVDDHIAENIRLTARGWAQKARLALHGKDTIRAGLRPAPFSEPLRKFMTTTTLSAVPTGINPIELLDHAVKVTSLGEGGIASERAIPYDARMTHATHLGTLDPIRTPESGHAGVDVRASIAAHRDDHGNLYTVARNARTGQVEHLRAGDVLRHVIAMPHQERSGQVAALVRGEMQWVPAARVDYELVHEAHGLSPATSLLPMLRGIQGNRAIMGSKMQTQALPLLEREAPLVQVKSHMPSGESFERLYGKMIVPTAPVGGVVEKIENGFIYIRPDATKTASEDGLVKVPFQEHFPFPSKTHLHHDLHVAPGQRVAAGQPLGESNFTRDHTLALGKNLRVAYIPYHGLNSNDAVVISEGAARKLTSEHMYREIYARAPGTETSRGKHRAYFGAKYPASAYEKLDEDGVALRGATVLPKDILVAGLARTEVRGADAMLGKIARALATPYKDLSLHWEHGVPGEVVEVVKTPTQVTLLIKTRESMQVGDKLAGRWGNKGVVSTILPDAQMLRDEQGRVIDVLMTSAGIVSRINPAQTIETIAAKVAEKTGKPIVYDNGSTEDATAWADRLMREHGVKDKEFLHDPVTGRTIRGTDGEGVTVGPQFILKLFKSTDTNFSGHAVGPYDLNQQPAKSGGDESAKALGKMEFDALLAHDARGVLREAASLRSQRNDEFWRAVQLGVAPPEPGVPFAFRKLTTLLEGAGVKVDKQGSRVRLLPLTDRDVLAKSSGEIEHGETLQAKNLRPVPGGLFDVAKTGGPQGTFYAHISLHEPIPHPMFEEPVRRLLGMTEAAFRAALRERGGTWFRDELAKIDVPRKLAQLREEVKRATGARLNDLVKQVKYLETLRRSGLGAHEAYTISKVPVIPPVFRPVTPKPNDPSELMVADANRLYSHLLDANQTLKTTVVASDTPAHREHVYDAVGAVFGTREVADEKLQKQNVKGFVMAIAGKGSPKGGYFQRKLMTRVQDVSGRGTAVPDGNLAMDQIGVPEQMLWQMWEPLLVGRLVRQGHPPLDAKRLVRERAPVARQALLAECRERPVFFNRAPTLHRFSIVGAYVTPTQGKSIRVNPFAEQGMNLDYDGDTLQIHTPIRRQAIEDVRRMTLPNLLLSDQRRDRLMVAPQQEAVLGITLAAKATPKAGPVRAFDSMEALKAAYRRGEVGLDDAVEVAATKVAAEDADDPPPLAGAGLTPDEVLAWIPPESLVGGA